MWVASLPVTGWTRKTMLPGGGVFWGLVNKMTLCLLDRLHQLNHHTGILGRSKTRPT